MPVNNTPQYGASSWSKGSNIMDLQLPSGGLVQIEKLDLPELVLRGIIDDVDSVTKMVNSELINPKQKPGQKKVTDLEQGLAFLKDPNASKIFELMDAVVIACVLQPQILPKPADDEAIDPNAFYIGGIPLTDKAVIFKAVMQGVDATAQQFRQEPA